MKIKIVLAASVFLMSCNVYAGSYSLTCDIPQTAVCGEYTFNSKSDRDNFVGRCKGGGGTVLSGSCAAGPACHHSSNGRSVSTYVYDKTADYTQRSCESNGGQFTR